MTDTRPEFSFIHWLSQNVRRSPDVTLGIGDDAAVLAATPNEWVVTKDVITQGVHFDSSISLELVGRKALAVNLSDLAAMTARPVAAFIGLVLPRQMTREEVEQIYCGVQKLADEWNVTIAGGDTNSWDGGLVISVTLLGTVPPGTAVRRDGAKLGDWIFVTGPLGGSLAAGRHARFSPRLREAELLKQSVTLHSMLDLSDGLGSDLFHLLDRSQVGARIDGTKIPIHPDVDAALPPLERMQHAIGDGEDFELLFTVSADDGQRLIQNPPPGLQPIHIGTVTADLRAVLLWEETEREFPRAGWSHGFGQPRRPE